MLRSFVLILALVFGSTAMAASSTDFGDLFTPTDGDYSLYIISKIFGNVEQSVLPGEAAMSGSELLGRVFGVFNVAVLGLGILMVLYTLIVAVLQTAHHGKMMGEKMSSMWTPIRIAFAIAMLVPKTNGYCIAQVAVMWLVVQGVGAADSLWNTALDYFEEGGSIGQNYNPHDFESNPEGDPSSELNTALNAVYASSFLENMLVAVTCVAAHNENATLEPEYSIQRYDVNGQYYLYFGSNVKDIDPANTSNQLGYECGSLQFNKWTADNFIGEDDAAERADIANDAQRMITADQMAVALLGVAKKIVRDEVIYESGTGYAIAEFNTIKGAALNYIDSMNKRSDVFTPPLDENAALDSLRAGGWILAGNYYQVLSAIEGTSTFIVDTDNTPNTPLFNQTSQESMDHKEQIDRARNLYGDFIVWPGAEEQAIKTNAQLSREEVEAAFSSQSEIFDEIGISESSASHMEGFLTMLTGDENSTDPVLRAARYGQDLMKTTSIIMVTLSAAMPLLALGFGWCTAQLPGELVWNSVLTSTLPLAYGILGFLYLQGAALGVYLPMVPFIIFVIGAIGWIFSVVESMIAAPLVALGLTIEGQHEIYGKAEPAVMLLINLLLRPSFMILGFLSAILIAWLAVDLINISMLSALEFGGIAPDKLFGHHVVSFMYVGVLIALVTKIFGLINYVPDRIMRWLSDNSQSVMGAEEVLSGGRQGTDATAKQVGDSNQATSNTTTSIGQGSGKYIGGKDEAKPKPEPGPGGGKPPGGTT